MADEFLELQSVRGITRKMRLHRAKEGDEVLDRLTRQELERRLGPPTGLVTHVVRFTDDQYAIRHHSWNQRCPHCAT